ncbi:unnamed protein product, partial [Effrenium voratum]
MSSPKKASGNGKDYKIFLEKCLAGPVEDTDAHDGRVLGLKKDIFAIQEDEESSSNDEGKEKAGAVCYTMDDSDDDMSGLDDDYDLEDAYNFDPATVAELLKKGEINEEQLVETLQVGMAEAMLTRMAAEQEDPDKEAARPDCQGALEGRMTPPCGGANFEAPSPPDPKELADKLQGARRRSSMSGRSALSDALRSNTAKTRRSIACAARKLSDRKE